MLLSAAVRLRAYPTLLEIAPQRIDRAGTLGEGAIGIRPDQIERVLREAGLPVLRPPGEYMERQAVLLAPGLQFGTRGTIDMDLPSHCLQGLVIVDIAGDDPRQPITAVDGASAPLAQGAMAIINSDLRYRRNMNSRKTPNFTSTGSIVGASRVRMTSAVFPSAVARVNTWSVVLTRRRAKAIRSAS